MVLVGSVRVRSQLKNGDTDDEFVLKNNFQVFGNYTASRPQFSAFFFFLFFSFPAEKNERNALERYVDL